MQVSKWHHHRLWGRKRRVPGQNVCDGTNDSNARIHRLQSLSECVPNVLKTFPQNGHKKETRKEELMDTVLRLFHFFKCIIKFDPTFILL